MNSFIGKNDDYMYTEYIFLEAVEDIVNIYSEISHPLNEINLNVRKVKRIGRFHYFKKTSLKSHRYSISWNICKLFSCL